MNRRIDSLFIFEQLSSILFYVGSYRLVGKFYSSAVIELASLVSLF